MVYRFEEFSFDDSRFELRRDGEPVAAEPRWLELLRYLIRNRQRLVLYSDIARDVWRQSVVSRSAISYAVSRLRRVLDDDGNIVRTIHGRGFRFAADVTTLAQASTPEAHGPTSWQVPFVGRDRELAALSASLDAAFSGRRQLDLLSGEPGIGKTRLAEEHAARATARGAHVAVSRCLEASGVPDFWPWIQVIRSVNEADPHQEIPSALAGWVDGLLSPAYDAEALPGRDQAARPRALDAARFTPHGCRCPIPSRGRLVDPHPRRARRSARGRPGFTLVVAVSRPLASRLSPVRSGRLPQHGRRRLTRIRTADP